MISGFRADFLRAFSPVGNASTKGNFIDGCYAHCQTGIQETWMRNDSPVLANTVRNCHYFLLSTEYVHLFVALALFIVAFSIMSI